MGKSTRATSWKSHRLADRLEAGGREWTVDLVARRATGVQGYRVSVVFIPHDGAGDREVELPNAATNVDVNHAVRDLTGAVERLRTLLEDAAS